MGGYLASDVFLWFQSEEGHAFSNPNGKQRFRVRGVLCFDTPFYGVSRTAIENPAVTAPRLTGAEAAQPRPTNWLSTAFGWVGTGLDVATAGTEQYIRLTRSGRPGTFRNILTYLAAHTLFASTCLDNENLRVRCERLLHELDIGTLGVFRNWYTILPQTTDVRAFCVLPALNDRLYEYWHPVPNSSPAVTQEVTAHISLFSPDGNALYKRLVGWTVAAVGRNV